MLMARCISSFSILARLIPAFSMRLAVLQVSMDEFVAFWETELGALLSGEKPVYNKDKAKTHDFYYTGSKLDTGIQSFYTIARVAAAGMHLHLLC
eukprot:COSAG01_NODE_13677_length_1549_cov_33.173793_2_plen_95_part_00